MSRPMAIMIAAALPDQVKSAASIHGVALAVDADDSPHRHLGQVSGEIYVAGNTSSNDFPATAGGAKSVAENVEAFAIRLTLEVPGDCDGDGTVSVAELITGVNIALGSAPITACPPFDTDGDGRVSVAELIRAVNVALSGCA